MLSGCTPASAQHTTRRVPSCSCSTEKESPASKTCAQPRAELPQCLSHHSLLRRARSAGRTSSASLRSSSEYRLTGKPSASSWPWWAARNHGLTACTIASELGWRSQPSAVGGVHAGTKTWAKSQKRRMRSGEFWWIRHTSACAAQCGPHCCMSLSYRSMKSCFLGAGLRCASCATASSWPASTRAALSPAIVMLAAAGDEGGAA